MKGRLLQLACITLLRACMYQKRMQQQQVVAVVVAVLSMDMCRPGGGTYMHVW